MVVKRDGRREEFSREKLFSGIAKACQKRPISQQSIEDLTQRIYDTISEEYAEEDSASESNNPPEKDEATEEVDADRLNIVRSLTACPVVRC